MLIRLTAALRERQYLGDGIDDIVDDGGGGEHATVVLDQNCLVSRCFFFFFLSLSFGLAGLTICL